MKVIIMHHIHDDLIHLCHFEKKIMEITMAIMMMKLVQCAIAQVALFDLIFTLSQI